MNCLGSCTFHHGKVRRVITQSLDKEPFQSRETLYCQAAIDADRKAGYSVTEPINEAAHAAWLIAILLLSTILLFGGRL